MSQNAISVKNLTKLYSKQKSNASKLALNNISLEIPQGSFFGLLGPNGAGKSTMINILAGLVNKTSGTVEVCGYDLDKNPREVKQNLGVVPQELILDPFFSVKEALELHAGYYGIPKSKRKTNEIMKAMHLEDMVHTGARRLSGGMRRRLLIGKALVHSPKVLILDEPTAGVDIDLRMALWNYAKELNAKGTTVVLTTHYLEEADELCDRIAIINHGEIVASDTKRNLLDKFDNKKVKFKAAEPIGKVSDDLLNFKPHINDNFIEFAYNPIEVDLGQIIASVVASGIHIVDVVSEDAGLEEIFLKLVANK